MTSNSRLSSLIRRRQPAPVIGTPGDSFPTSAHVHLYLDPQTLETASPMLFADCEGLNGGEKKPKTLNLGSLATLDEEAQPSRDFHRSPPKDIPWTKPLSVGNHVTVLQLVRGNSARLRSALGRWNPVEQTGLCIYSCFRTYRSELFNRVLPNQQTATH